MQKTAQKMKKLTAKYLERAAIHYLGRYSSSEANLRKILEKKAKRRIPDDEDAPEDLSAWIDAIIIKCREYGYVNDAQYGRIRANTLARRGWGERRILRDMTFKGVDEDLAKEVLATLQEEEGISDQSSALLLARKRKVGPYRRGPALDDLPQDEKMKLERREMGIFARAGFGLYVARTIIHASDADELEEEWDFKG